MKLYYEASSCSLVTRIMLHEVGVESEYESVNLSTKITETGIDFYTINPAGLIPTLQLDNGELLTETFVILEYLADRYHATELLPPPNDMRRYRILEWLAISIVDLYRHLSLLFSPVLSDNTKQIIFEKILTKKLTFVDKHLEHNKFLMGDEITVADISLFVNMLWLAIQKPNATEWPNLLRYFDDMKRVESVKEALKEEGLGHIGFKFTLSRNKFISSHRKKKIKETGSTLKTTKKEEE